MNDIEKVIKIVCNFLNENKLRYVIVGGVAVMFHGIPRTTVDIDLIIDMNKREIEQFGAFLQSKNFSFNIQDMIDAMNERSHCTVYVNDSLLRLDIQGVYSDFDRATLERAINVKIFDISISLGSAEDTLINKILFESEQDIRDASSIFTRHKDSLDYDYIEKTCDGLGILSKWIEFKERMIHSISEDLRDYM